MAQLKDLSGLDVIAREKSRAIRDRILVWRGQNTKAAEVREIVDQHPYDLFPTPPELARHLVALLGCGEGDDVLDPEAGTGALCAAITESGARAFYVEINPSLHKILTRDGYEGMCQDFLTISDVPFEFIAMNPPFSSGQDRVHVLHAFSVIPHGVIAAIVSASSMTLPRYKEFQDFVFAHSVTNPEKIPAGTFRKSGTSVTTYLIHLKKE